MTNKSTSVQMIPIADIHVANPRVRNQRIHRGITRSIETVGLKRPVSVRKASPDETSLPYALICGQGRLEACKLLGHREIPALILDVDEHTGHVMSIVENVARRTPRAAETMEQVQVLRERGYSDPEIATKLGCTPSWVNSVANLMERGERRLLAAAEAGHISLALAVNISRANDRDAQQLLMDAYEAGELKGKKVTVVRQILAHQAEAAKKGTSTYAHGAPRKKLTPEDLAKLYKRDVEMHQRIQKKAEFTQQSLLLARQIFKELFASKEFCGLLQSEGLTSVPQPLADLLPRRGWPDEQKQSSGVRLGFEKDCVDIQLAQLHYSVAMPTGTKASVKYQQIVSSVRTVGLVEPIVVTLDRGTAGRFLVLDGRMRLEALRELGASVAPCLISTDDEGYTYNKQVNRLSVVQEHRMILRAAERGVSVEQLSEVLNISASSIRDKFRLLDGVCDEAIAILADKPAAAGVFRLLRKMKPFRQIDAAQTMVNLGDYSIKLATALLQNTPVEQLIEPLAAKTASGAPIEALQRLERELAALQADTKLLEENYGPASLQLEIVKTHIGSTLLDNAAVVRWLAKNKPDHLQQLQRIADIKLLKAG